jgi:DNA-binding NtrC family response regulator
MQAESGMLRAMAPRVNVSVTTPAPALAPAVPPLDEAAAQRIAIVEDDPVLGALAAELCRGMGAEPVVYGAPADFLEAARSDPPRILVLDWRLQGQLGAAAFMAVRHRYPAMRVVCWTASPAWHLPQMILQDPMTTVIDKAAGPGAFEAAVRQAMG